MDKELLEKYYFRVLNFLSYRPRSQQEIKNYLQKVCPEKHLIHTLFLRLQNEGHIDDSKFSSWWLEQRLTFRLRGPLMIKYELIKKGVDSQIIDQTLSTISSKGRSAPGRNYQQMMNALNDIIQKKLRLYSHLPPVKLKQKLYSYLSRRGFNFDLIKRVVDESIKK